MRKVTDARFALRQILSDARNPHTLTALILGEYDVSEQDVMSILDVAQDVIADSRRERTYAPMPQPVPQPIPQASQSSAALRASVADNKAKALAAMQALGDDD
jgi:hypothetical protein